jgi:hypothetical protein
MGPQYGYHPQQGPQGYPPQQFGGAPPRGQQGPQQAYGPPQGPQGPQQAYGPPQGEQDQQYSLAALPSTETINSQVEGRLAALRTALKLTPDQMKVWTPFEQASRELAKLEADRIAQVRESRPQQTASAQPPSGAPPAGAKPAPGAPQQATTPPAEPNLFEELQHTADALMKDGAAFKKLADAGAALYKTLDNDQKQRFSELSSDLIPHQ